MKSNDLCITLSTNEIVQIKHFNKDHWTFCTYDDPTLEFIHVTDLEYLMTSTFSEAIKIYPEYFI